MNKQIFGHLKRIASAWECDVCMGGGFLCWKDSDGTCDSTLDESSCKECPEPCPTCADVRKLADGEWCEWINREGEFVEKRVPDHGFGLPINHYRHECLCGHISISPTKHLIHAHSDNPDYSIPDLVAQMKTLKLWGKFLWHVWTQLIAAISSCLSKLLGWGSTPIDNHVTFRNWGDDITMFAEILTDPDLFKQAVLSYLEGVE
jgi:hypothetical protein